MEAGEELDRKVAEAVGAEHLGNSMEGSQYGPAYSLDGFRFSCPSIDLNAAFLVAERVGLWKEHTLDWCESRGEWQVWSGEQLVQLVRTGECEPLVAASAPALAICWAILALKEAGNGE